MRGGLYPARAPNIGRFRPRRRSADPGDLPGDLIGYGPTTILGQLLHTWLRADGLDVQGSVSGGVTAWRNRSGGGDLEAPESREPILAPNLIGNASALDFDGGDTLSGTLSVALATDSRPYVWAVGRSDDASAGSRVFVAVKSDDINPARILAIYAGIGADQSHFVGQASLSDGVEAVSGPALDTSPHLFEYGALSTTVKKFTVDGVGFDGTLTGGLETGGLSLIDAGAILSSGSYALRLDGAVAEIVVATGTPSAAQLTAMRSYFGGRPYGLSIAP